VLVILFSFCWIHCGHYFACVESICCGDFLFDDDVLLLKVILQS